MNGVEFNQNKIERKFDITVNEIQLHRVAYVILPVRTFVKHFCVSTM